MGFSCFAGIWRWSETEPHFAFLTCEPNPLVTRLHETAMPVILAPKDYDLWLDGRRRVFARWRSRSRAS
jgi:putative SOS response-associated peptidase YedK